MEALLKATMAAPSKPRGFAALGTFLFFGAGMAGLAAITLIWKGTPLDYAWKLNPAAYQQLASWGRKMGVLFLFLSGALLLASLGWFRRRLWGWKLAVAIIAAQLIGDFINLLRGDWLRGVIGVAVAGALLLYLSTPGVRGAFFRDRPRNS